MENQTKKKSSGLLKKSLPGIVVSIIIIGILLYFVDFRELLNSFKSVSIILLV